MTLLTFSLILFAGSIAAGLLGALTGLGGGVIIIPMLVLGFGVDLRAAVGASLVAIIATSSGAAAAYVREGYTNIRIGMVLEIATAIGAMGGAALAVTGVIPTSAVAVIFGAAVLWSAAGAVRRPPPSKADPSPDSLAARLRLSSTYPGETGSGAPVAYAAHHVPAGFGIMLLGGVLAGLTGIGAGVVKVLAMDRVMRLPFKVSTTTSNFMIGVTAATGAGVYLARGQVDPALCFPIILGATTGSIVGTRVLFRLRTRTLRLVFAVVVSVMGVQMIYRGLTGGV